MKKLVLLICFVFLCACETKESLEVAIRPLPIKFKLSVPIDPLEVEDQFSDIEDVDVIGGVFGELAEMMANAEIEEGDLGKFAFTPCLYEISEIEKIDFNYVRSITLENIYLQINSSAPDASLDFVEFAEGHIRALSLDEFNFLQQDFSLCTDIENIDADQTIDYWDLDVSNMTKAFSFTKDRQIISNYITPEIHLKNWRDLLSEKRHLLLFFRVKIDKVPDYDFTITGDINLGVDIELKNEKK